MQQKIKLLESAQQGGCSAKLPAQLLADIVRDIPMLPSDKLLVGPDKYDDAYVYQITPEIALIHTTDFFPPLCDDPYDFGQIAAANSFSDIYAMGGQAISALNIVMFPSDRLPLSALKSILAGGADKAIEAGAVLAGGHTLNDDPPKYGLAVTGIVHPARIITNDQARPGDGVILTKAIGTGCIISGQKMGETAESDYNLALEAMKQLNKTGATLMQQYNVKAATDITGFGLAGHALAMAMASNTPFVLNGRQVPLLSGAYALTDLGCIASAAFRNLRYTEKNTFFDPQLDYNLKMLMVDAQTSGGLLICVPERSQQSLLRDLRSAGYDQAALIGYVATKQEIADLPKKCHLVIKP